MFAVKPVCSGIFHEGMSDLRMLVGDGHESEQGGSKVLAALTRHHRNCLTLFTAVNETSRRSTSLRLGLTQSGAWTARSGDAPSQFKEEKNPRYLPRKQIMRAIEREESCFTSDKKATSCSPAGSLVNAGKTCT